MSKKNIKKTISLNINNLFATISSNKKIIFIGLGFALLGFLIAFGNIIVDENNISILGHLKNNTFSFLKFELELIIYINVLIFIPIILSFNYYLFLLSFTEITISCYLIFSYIFNTIAVDTLFAILSAILIFIPIICILFLNITVFIADTCQIINYPLCILLFLNVHLNVGARYVKIAPLHKKKILK